MKAPSLAILPLVLSTLAVAQRDVDVRIDQDAPGSASSVEPHIASSDGWVYAIWIDSRNGAMTSIYFNRSNDGGRTWMANDVKLNTGVQTGNGTIDRPDIAVDGSTIAVVWDEARVLRPNVFANVSTDYGATWLSSDVRLCTGTTPGDISASTAKVAVEGNTIAAVWMDQRVGGSNTRVYANRSTDGGATWLASATPVSPLTNRWIDCPCVALTSGIAHTTYRTNRNGLQADIYYNRSIDAGASWPANDTRIDAGTPAGTVQTWCPQLVTSGNHIVVIWLDFRTPFLRETYVNRSHDDGASWQGEQPVGQGTVSHEIPTIAMSGSNVYIAWSQQTTFGSDIWFQRSLDAGATWMTSDAQINVWTSGSYNPRIAADGDNVLLSWVRSSDPFANVSSDAGSTWLPNEFRMIQTPRTNTQPFEHSVAMDGSNAHVIWRDRRNRGYDIFTNIACGAQSYGSGLAGSGGIEPTIELDGYPMLGENVSIDLANGRGGAAAALLLSFAGPANLPFLGGTILVDSPTLSVPMPLGGAAGAPGQGSATLPLGLPNAPAFHALRINTQGIVVDPAATAGVSMTRGLEIWIG